MRRGDGLKPSKPKPTRQRRIRLRPMQTDWRRLTKKQRWRLKQQRQMQSRNLAKETATRMSLLKKVRLIFNNGLKLIDQFA